MEHYKIERQGKYIVVNILHGSEYTPMLLFASLPFFHDWAKGIAESCKEMAQLAGEIEKVYKDLGAAFGEPQGTVWDYVKGVEKIDSLGEK